MDQDYKSCCNFISGGNDIGEFPDRDIVEDWLLDHAEKNKLPALGICRGMQMMAVRYGAKLDLVDGHVGTHHYLTGVIKGRVNSYHNQGFRTSPKFRSLAWSEDGNIEAIGHEFLPWEGWMWHPERELIFSPRDIERLKALFKWSHNFAAGRGRRMKELGDQIPKCLIKLQGKPLLEYQLSALRQAGITEIAWLPDKSEMFRIMI